MSLQTGSAQVFNPSADQRLVHCQRTQASLHTCPRLKTRKAWRCPRYGKMSHTERGKLSRCRAATSSEDHSDHSNHSDRSSLPKHSAQAEQAMESLTASGKIGSEYGEVSSLCQECHLQVAYQQLLYFDRWQSCISAWQGFVEFRIGAQPLHLDVDTLNERLKVRGANHMRHAMRPDEAFGMIFSLDNVIINTRQMQRRAWQRVAREEGLVFPSIERHIYDMRPERAITEVCCMLHTCHMLSSVM